MILSFVCFFLLWELFACCFLVYYHALLSCFMYFFSNRDVLHAVACLNVYIYVIPLFLEERTSYLLFLYLLYVVVYVLYFPPCLTFFLSFFLFVHVFFFLSCFLSCFCYLWIPWLIFLFLFSASLFLPFLL